MRRSVSSAVYGLCGLAFLAGALILLVAVVSALSNEARRDPTFASWSAIAFVLLVPGAVLWWRSRRP